MGLLGGLLKKVGRKSDLLLFSLDPGETVGYSVFKGPDLLVADQKRLSKPSQIDEILTSLSSLFGVPDVLVVEAYRIYPNKAKQHVGDALFTPRVIGAIELWAALQRPQVRVVFQMASQAKGFATDRRLRQLKLYQKGVRHANDAIRHAVYFLLFGALSTPNGSRKVSYKDNAT